MSDRHTLLRAVLENPADDTARLVLADSLRESDDRADQLQGQFLWAGVIAHQYAGRSLEYDRYRLAMKELEPIIHAGHPARWLANLGIGPSPLIRGDWTFKVKDDRLTIRIDHYVGVFTRGMLSSMTVPLGEIFQLGLRALESWPLERVDIADIPGLAFFLKPKGQKWELIVRYDRQMRNIPVTSEHRLRTARVSFPDRDSLLNSPPSDREELVIRVRRFLEQLGR
jgi:uncharacterized protein (TIGR02996 family)